MKKICKFGLTSRIQLENASLIEFIIRHKLLAYRNEAYSFRVIHYPELNLNSDVVVRNPSQARNPSAKSQYFGHRQ